MNRPLMAFRAASNKLRQLVGRCPIQSQNPREAGNAIENLGKERMNLRLAATMAACAGWFFVSARLCTPRLIRQGKFRRGRFRSKFPNPGQPGRAAVCPPAAAGAAVRAHAAGTG